MRILLRSGILTVMPTSALPDNQTKVSYILLKTQKRSLEIAAKIRKVSMSQVITDALDRARVFTVDAPPKRKRG